VNERWRKPATILASEPDGRGNAGAVIETSDGRRQVDPLLTVDAETSERMRLGYLCANCLEPFERAWPTQCPVCGVYVREFQAAYFAQQFRGIEIRRTYDHDRELAAIEEQIAREKETP